MVDDRGLAPLVEMRGISKRFPGVLANDDVGFTVGRGEIHALLGENGAGKSTLMQILYGFCLRDAGEILIDGTGVSIGSPKQAIGLGIGMIHQEFMLIHPMTVAENVVLGLSGPSAGSASPRPRVPCRPSPIGMGWRSIRTPSWATCRSAFSSASRS